MSERLNCHVYCDGNGACPDAIKRRLSTCVGMEVGHTGKVGKTDTIRFRDLKAPILEKR